jgi:hypothetical protein
MGNKLAKEPRESPEKPQWITNILSTIVSIFSEVFLVEALRFAPSLSGRSIGCSVKSQARQMQAI